VPAEFAAPTGAKRQIISWDAKREYRRAGTAGTWHTLRRAIFFQVVLRGREG
jgi:hypothetical protein